MSAPTSPPTSPRNKSKLMDCKVLLLDDSIITYPIPIKSVGQDLYNKVVQKLELLEADYFDLQYTDVQGILCWMDHDKQILRQISRHSLDFRFVVKFYTPDPGLLEEEYTRYLFALQVKRDLSTGTMPCQEHTAVLLASYIVQAEFGDFMEGDENAILLYLRNTKLLPKQNDALERKILEHHREHAGQNPAEAEFNLLDTARKVDLYGIEMHPAKDHETVPLHLAVAHMGILVFQNLTKINTFSWAKIRKLSFKRKKFLVKLHPDGYGYYKDTVEFYFESRNECKNFWKKCLEHHAFFRCHSVKRLPRNKTRVVSRGSSFRYSGRTQKQLIEHVRENFNKRPTFQRSTSMRTVSMSHSAMATPKTGTLSSRDLHMGHHLSLSSGSRIINPERISMEEIHKQNGKDTGVHTDAHDGPTPSQSRSLQTFHLGDENKNEVLQMNATSVDMEGNYDNLMKHRPSTEQRTGALDDFNCSYFKSDYDSNQLLGVGKTTDEKDYPDNTSQDSYQLTESRDSLDFDRVETNEHRMRGAYDGIDGKQLVKELQRQFDAREQVGHCEIDEAMQLDLMTGGDDKCVADDNISYRQRAEQRDSVDAGERRRKRLSREDAVRGLDDDSSVMENGFVSKVKPEHGNGKRLPLQGEKAVLSEDLRGTVEHNEVPAPTGNEAEIRTIKSVELDNAVVEQLPGPPDRSTVQSCEALKPCPASEAAKEVSDQFKEAVAPLFDRSLEFLEVAEQSQTVFADDYHLLQATETEKNQLKTAQTSSCDRNNVQAPETTDNQSVICQRVDEEILYVLHKRHLVSTGEQTDESLLKEVRYASLPLSFCRSRSPSPGRLATKEEQKAQLEKIKATLTSMAVPPMKSPKSPGGRKRAFDFVIYNRLPPKDSFSCKDDSLSPSSLEKEIMMHRRATKTVSSPETIREREPGPSRSRGTSVDKEQPAEELQKLNDIDDLLANAESESDAELDAKVSEAVTPEMEDEVNRVLSDFGQDSVDSNESSIATEERLDDLPPPIKESESIDADFLENIPLPPPLIESGTDFELLGGSSVEMDVVAINISEIPLPDGGNKASFESSLEGLLIAPPFEVIEENLTDHFDVSELPPPLPIDEFIEAILEVEEFPPIPPPVDDFGEPLITCSEEQNIIAIPDEELPKICLSKVQHQPSSEDSLLPPPPPWLEELEVMDDYHMQLPLPEIIIRAASDVDLPSLDDSTFRLVNSGSIDATIPVICVSVSNEGGVSSVGSLEEQPEKTFSEGACVRSAPLAIDPTGTPPEFTQDFKNDLQIREEKLLKKLSKDSGDVTSSSSRSLNDELDGHLPSRFSPVTDLPPAAAAEAGFLLDNNLPDSELSKHGHVMEWLEEQALLNLAMIPSQDKEISDEDDVERPHAEHDLFDLYRNLETETWGNPFLVSLSRDTSLPPPVPSFSSALDASSSEDADCSLMAASKPNIDSHFKHSASNHGFPDPPLSDISSEGGVVYPLKEEFPDSRRLFTAAAAAESSYSVPISVEQKVPSPLSISSEDDVERPQHGVADLAEASSALNSASFLPGYFPVAKDSSRPILLDLSSESEDLPSEELPDVGDILDSNLLANPYAENLSESDAETSPPVPCLRPDRDGVMEQVSGLPAPVQPFFHQEKEFDISSGSSSNDLPFEYLDEPDVFAALDEIDKPFVLRPSNADSDPELHNRDEGDDADSESSSEGFMPHDDFVSCVLKHHAPRSTETDVDTIHVGPFIGPLNKVPATLSENQTVAARRHEFHVSKEQSNVAEDLDKDEEQSKSGSHCSGSENLNLLCESRLSHKQLVRSSKVLETEIDSSFEVNPDEQLEIKPDASSKAESVVLSKKAEWQESDTKQSEATDDSCLSVSLEAESCAMQVSQVEEVASRDDSTIGGLRESSFLADEIQKNQAHESFSSSCCSNAEGGLYAEAQSTISLRETYREASSAPEDDRP